MRLQTLLPLLAALLLGLAVTAGDVTPAMACPSCSEAALSSGSADPATAATDAEGNVIKPALGEGFYYSILLMLAVPFGMFGTFGYFLWQYSRDHQLRHAINATASHTR